MIKEAALRVSLCGPRQASWPWEQPQSVNHRESEEHWVCERTKPEQKLSLEFLILKPLLLEKLEVYMQLSEGREDSQRTLLLNAFYMWLLKYISARTATRQ